MASLISKEIEYKYLTEIELIMRFFLDIAYNGANFHGWQIQPNASSVQENIEKSLSILLRNQTSITGAGRTDTGVNARQMYAHFDFETDISNNDKILLSLNRMLGPDIHIRNIFRVEESAHARFDAVKRTYKYFVSFTKNPFTGTFFWQSSTPLRMDKMNEAASLLLHTDDFTSFAKLHSDAKTNICKVTEAYWMPIEKDSEASGLLGTPLYGIVFTITADRFLRNMVRAVVGTLIEVGREKLSLTGFKEIIESKDRCLAGTSMPANPLFLWDIKYPFPTHSPH